MKKTSSKTASTAQASPSITVRNLRIKLAPNERLVLYALASRMQSLSSEVWPSIPTLAEDTSLSESTARRVVRRLMELGILVEQNNDRRTRTFCLVLQTPIMVTGQPSSVTPLHGDTYPSHGDSDGCQPDRVKGVTVTGEDKEEGTSEAKREETTRRSSATLVPLSLTLTTAESQVLDLITSTPELTNAHPDPVDFAKELVAIVDGKKFDLCKKLRRMVEWMRRNRCMSYGSIIQHVTEDAAKAKQLTPPPAPKPPSVPVELVERHDLAPAYRRGPRF